MIRKVFQNCAQKGQTNIPTYKFKNTRMQLISIRVFDF